MTEGKTKFSKSHQREENENNCKITLDYDYVIERLIDDCRKFKRIYFSGYNLILAVLND